MIDGSFDPAFALDGALKDADLILEAAAGAGVEMGLMPGIRDHLARASAAGHGDLDMSATYLEHRSEALTRAPGRAQRRPPRLTGRARPGHGRAPPRCARPARGSTPAR